MNRNEAFTLADQVCAGFDNLARQSKEELYYFLQCCIVCEHKDHGRPLIPIKGEFQWVYLCNACFKNGSPIHA